MRAAVLLLLALTACPAPRDQVVLLPEAGRQAAGSQERGGTGGSEAAGSQERGGTGGSEAAGSQERGGTGGSEAAGSEGGRGGLWISPLVPRPSLPHSLSLTTPYDTATVRPDGRVQPGTTTPAQVQARYGAVLATLPEAGRLFTLHFDAGGTTLTAASQAAVPALLAEVGRRGRCELEITGHTDTTGTALANDALSLARAAAVRELLVQAGLTATFVRVVGRGERDLLIETADDVAEPRNRRVVITVR